MPGIGQLARATNDFIRRRALQIPLRKVRLLRPLRRLSPAPSRHRLPSAAQELGVRFERNPVWKHVFPGGSEWLEGVLDLKKSHIFGPLPALVGPDLKDVERGELKNKKVTLIVNDWGGAVGRLKESLYKCLGSGLSSNNQSELSLKSGLTVNVRDAITSSLAVTVSDLSEVAKVNNDGISTNIIHYGDHQIQHLDHRSIGGIRDGDSVSYNELCALKTQFAGKETLWRIFQSKAWHTKVVPVKDTECPTTENICGWSKALGSVEDTWDPSVNSNIM